MQHMPDKEFDNLFRDKFIDAEIEPSANLWANIESQLTPKRKRSFPIYWMAAASVAVAITALLVFQKTEKIKLRGTSEVASANKPATEDVIAVPSENIAQVAETSTMPSTKSFASATPKTEMAKVQNLQYGAPEKKIEKNQEDLQPNNMIAHLPIKKIEIEPMNVVPKETVVAADNNQTMIASAEVTQKLENANTISETEVATEKKGIRNVGDLVNFVVEKIDKRDKKLIRFNTDDDDNSSIIGINLGFVKLNSKNKNRN